MRKFIVLILLTSFASTVDAQCKQFDLTGRWDLLIDGLSCQFYLDEQGRVYKGACYDLFLREDRPESEDLDTLGWSGSVSVNGYCKVSGSIISEAFCPFGPAEVCQKMADENDFLDSGEILYQSIEYDLAGRASLQKDVVKGEAQGNYLAGDPEPHFSMVKY